MVDLGERRRRQRAGEARVDVELDGGAVERRAIDELDAVPDVHHPLRVVGVVVDALEQQRHGRAVLGLGEQRVADRLQDDATAPGARAVVRRPRVGGVGLEAVDEGAPLDRVRRVLRVSLVRVGRRLRAPGGAARGGRRRRLARARRRGGRRGRACRRRGRTSRSMPSSRRWRRSPTSRCWRCRRRRRHMTRRRRARRRRAQRALSSFACSCTDSPRLTAGPPDPAGWSHGRGPLQACGASIGRPHPHCISSLRHSSRATPVRDVHIVVCVVRLPPGPVDGLVGRVSGEQRAQVDLVALGVEQRDGLRQSGGDVGLEPGGVLLRAEREVAREAVPARSR